MRRIGLYDSSLDNICLQMMNIEETEFLQSDICRLLYPEDPGLPSGHVSTIMRNLLALGLIGYNSKRWHRLPNVNYYKIEDEFLEALDRNGYEDWNQDTLRELGTKMKRDIDKMNKISCKNTTPDLTPKADDNGQLKLNFSNSPVNKELIAELERRVLLTIREVLAPERISS